MADASVAVSIFAGATSGLLASIVGHVLLDSPRIMVRARDDLHAQGDDEFMASYVKITNVRGRPVIVEHAWFVLRGRLSAPKGWLKDMPCPLREGATVSFTFLRSDYLIARPLVIDSAGRVWPRRYRPLLRWRALRARGFRAAFGSGKKGPSEKHLKHFEDQVTDHKAADGSDGPA